MCTMFTQGYTTWHDATNTCYKRWLYDCQSDFQICIIDCVLRIINNFITT